MKQIPLTRGLVALVDDEDYERIAAHHWFVHSHARKGRRTHYACRESACRTIWMHREITGCPPHLQVDHIDGNGLNNVRSNLRNCTAAQNRWNSRRSRLGVSGFRGVKKSGARWTAVVRINWKSIHLGTYATPLEAALVRDGAVRKYHGEFAVLNFPELDPNGLPAPTVRPNVRSTRRAGVSAPTEPAHQRGVRRHG